MGDWILALMIGFVLDLLLGDPEWLYHPVCIIGKYISFTEKKLRARGGNLRRSAVFLTVSTVVLTMLTVGMILWLLSLLGRIPLLIGMSLLNWMGIAVTCMAKEARDVEKALKDVSGVSDAEADLETKTARIILERPVADAALMDAVRAKAEGMLSTQ